LGKRLHVANLGCGDSFISAAMLINLDNIDKLVGMDIQENALKLSREVFLQNDLTQPLVRGTVYNLPFQDEQFDLTVCLQVLEHLEDLDTAMREVSRITKRYCLLSVPNEPLFRMANVLRGQYLKTKGNPAAHIQHFGQRSFVKFVERYFNIVAVQTPAFIWNMVLAEKVTRGTTHD
jgi:ubiquinone/menaquinone biosynthesis C-methylase UbiE